MYTISVYINQFNSSNVFSYSGTNFLQKMSASSHPKFFIALYVDSFAWLNSLFPVFSSSMHFISADILSAAFTSFITETSSLGSRYFSYSDTISSGSLSRRFLAAVSSNVESELRKIGLRLINVNVTDITDESGYIEALGKEAAAKAINEARIQVAERNREGSIGEANAVRDQRISVAAANATAVDGENKSKADVANYLLYAWW